MSLSVRTLRCVIFITLSGSFFHISGEELCNDRQNDLKSSVELLSERSISPPEGLWEITGEQILVLILRNRDGRLDITIAPEDESGTFPAGHLIGYLEESPDTKVYSLHLSDMPHRDGKLRDVTGSLPFSRRCLLKIGDNGESLLIEKADASITVNPLAWFPYLNRLLKLRFRDPAAKIPAGLRKIAPGFDGGTASRRFTIYL